MSNHLSQFISPAQFQSLPPFSYVKEIGINLVPVGLEASFDTNDTLSQSASITRVPFIIYNEGANLAHARETVTIETDKGNPMKITGVKKRAMNLNKILWDDGDSDMKTFPSSLTVIRNWPNYDSWIMPIDNENSKNVWSGNNCGHPALNSIYYQGLASRAVETSEVLEWKYKPKIGLIKYNIRRAHGFAIDDDELFASSAYIPTNQHVFKKKRMEI